LPYKNHPVHHYSKFISSVAVHPHFAVGKFAADARREIRSRISILQVSRNKADAVKLPSPRYFAWIESRTKDFRQDEQD